jgi:hypothetical protein
VPVLPPKQPLAVYQLSSNVHPLARCAAQLVVDHADEDLPYTITFHLAADELNLTDLIASGQAVLIAGSDPAGAIVPGTPPLELLSG